MENVLQYKDDGLLVTGASGHSARYFFENLSAENYNKEIKCLVRKGSKVEHLKRYNLKLKFIEVDYNDVDDLKKSMISENEYKISNIYSKNKLLPEII